MPRVPLLKGTDLIKILKKKGFILNRVRGSHHILVNPGTKTTLSVPVHKGRVLGKGITVAIIKDAGMTLEDFIKMF